MKKFIVGLVVLMAISISPAAQARDWKEGARTQERQEHRLEVLRNEKVTLKRVRERIQALRLKKERLHKKVVAHKELFWYIKQVGDHAVWLYETRVCESTNNYLALSSTGKYRGAYQFDKPTWANYGGYEDPIDAPWYVQDAKASITYQARGPSPWPHCGY